MRILLWLMLFSSGIALGMGSNASKGLGVLSKCLAGADVSCALTQTCTQAKLCTLCGSVKASGSCSERAHAYAAIEGVTGFLEGSCKDLCGVGDTALPVRAKSKYTAGDEVFIARNNSDGKTALGAVLSNGQVVLADVSYSGARKNPGAVLTTGDALSGPIDDATRCVSSKANSLLRSCFSAFGKCDKGLSKDGRCSLCKAAVSCSDRDDYFAALFGFNCSGC